ncbi:MAG: hypothetical protein EBZ77_17705, partial [Chitinophagia bacterium]|nr:hypothetical protein [Chitinophagia bacterium]
QAHLVRNACAALTHVLKRVLSRSPVGLVFSICSHQKAQGATRLPIGFTANFEADDQEMLTEASDQSRELADTLLGPRASKLHSFASRSQHPIVPEFRPARNSYVWSHTK